MSDHQTNSHRFGASLVLIGVSIVICLLFVEAALRLFFPFHFAHPIEAFEYDKELAYRFQPGTQLFVTTDYQQEIRTNHQGSLNFQENLMEYNTIIFALGDSYTQGLGVPSDCSYPFQLDLILNFDNTGNYSKNYGVVNLALGPYGCKQQLITLERFAGLIRKPNIVLYLGCENDYSDDLLFDSGIRHKNLVKNSPSYGWIYYPMKLFFIDTEIGKRLKYIVQETITQRRPKTTENSDSQIQSVAEKEKNQIREIIQTSRNMGAVPVLSWSTFGDSYDWLKSWAEENEILFADWRPWAISVSNAIPGLPWDNSHSAAHYRSWINFVIAQSFAKEIKKITASSEFGSN